MVGGSMAATLLLRNDILGNIGGRIGMSDIAKKQGNDARELVFRYSDMLYRICVVQLCNEQDAQDAVQDTFCRYLEKAPAFESEEHRKAWLIKVACNICRDMLRYRRRHPSIALEEVESCLAAPEHRETLYELLELPVKYRSVVYLHYVEGYKVKEIAKILRLTEGAVKTRLKRGRERMKEAREGEKA